MNERPDEDWREAVGTSWLLGFGVGVVVLALLATAYLIGYNKGKGEGGRGGAVVQSEPKKGTGEAKPAPSGPGKALFTQDCGTCHTLADAGTSGTVGPNLDELQPEEAQVLAAIENGGLGSGTMPPGLVTGADAQAVAAYVAGAAGK